FFSSRRRHTRFSRDWSSDVCSSDLDATNTQFCEATNPVQISLDGTLSIQGVVNLNLLDLQCREDKSFTKVLLKSCCCLPYLAFRSEERRVGKECRSRWSQAQCKINM